MPALPDTLPDDPEQLKALLLAFEKEAKEKEHSLSSQIANLTNQLHVAFEALRLERVRRFSSKSEKAPGQGELFNEADAEPVHIDPNATPVKQTRATQSSSKKKTGTRKPLPDELPRQDEVYELNEDEQRCPCGCLLEEIGESVSEQLDIEPATVRVIRHVRKKYACKACEDTVKSAPKPTLLLPKSIATANTMAYLITAKYADGLPLYRLSNILQRYGVDLPRQTLSESVLTTAKKLEPLIDYLETRLLSHSLIHMDETRVQVLNEPGKSAQSQSYMWVRRGGPPNNPIIHFHYDPGRSSAVADTLLSNYSGALMTDGYEPYRKVAAIRGLTHLCCWAHVRRKFMDAKKAQAGGQSGKADKAIAFIAKLYAIEKRCTNSDAATRHRKRSSDSAPVLESFHAWLLEQQQKVPPKRELGKAINYTVKFWPELSRYIEDGSWPIDNNAAENAIRPFVIGRKAWLFSSSTRGAKASANLYSLIETAKANNQEPYQYLCWLLNKLPSTPDDQIETLAPWNKPLVSTEP